MHYIIETSEGGTRTKVYEKPEPVSAERYVYVSKKGGRPLSIGMNAAKRRARRLDKQDRAKVVKLLGSGLPMQAQHHQQLVRSRHRYYHEQHEEFLRGQSSAA
jgi:hypothetical protein